MDPFEGLEGGFFATSWDFKASRVHSGRSGS